MSTTSRTYWVILEMVGGTRFRSEQSYDEARADEMVGRLRAEGIGGAYMEPAYVTQAYEIGSEPSASPVREPEPCRRFQPDEYAAGACAACGRYEADHVESAPCDKCGKNRATGQRSTGDGWNLLLCDSYQGRGGSSSGKAG